MGIQWNFNAKKMGFCSKNMSKLGRISTLQHSPTHLPCTSTPSPTQMLQHKQRQKGILHHPFHSNVTSTTTETTTTTTTASSASNTATSIQIAWDPINASHQFQFHPLQYQPTKYPIVLLHGLFGYNQISFGPQHAPFIQIKYWRGIAEALRHLGCQVYVPSNGPVASIRSRAYALHEYLSTHLHGREVNLVAHSMGGLDARYLLSHIPSDKYSVNSLTTIATPHRGSSFMDFVQQTLGLGYALDPSDPVVVELHRRRREAAQKEQQGGQQHPDELIEEKCQQKDTVDDRRYDSRVAGEHRTARFTADSTVKHGTRLSVFWDWKSIASRFDRPAYANLTREYCRAFNAVTNDVRTVHYNSYAAVAPVSKFDPLYISQQVITPREGPNDGLVSVESATWGHFEGLVANVDHWGLLPPRRLRPAEGHQNVSRVMAAQNAGFADGERRKRGGAYCGLEFYMKVADTLRRKGF